MKIKVPEQLKDLNIIPIEQNSKKPAIPWKEYQKKKYDKPLPDSTNYAVVCGKTSNNLIVVDFDHRRLYDYFFADIETFTVETPSGGVHLYFYSNQPVKKIPKFNGFPIDVQGEGSLVVIPPSRIDLKEYRVIKDVEIQHADVIELLSERLPRLKREKLESLKDIVEELKRRIPLSEYVERYISKEYVGRGYWQGKCPFHSDENPSFTVYEENYYCFGCGAHGDVFSFVMEYHSMDFKEAVKYLSSEAGIDIHKKKQKQDKDTQKPVIQTSFLELDGKLIEQVFDGTSSKFAVFDGSKVEYVEKIETDSFIYEPFQADTSKELVEGAVLLPEKAEDFESLEKLVAELRDHIHKFVDLSEEYEIFSTYYILLTWIYDRLNTLPYLRVLGDTGCGKSRFLDVVGRLCYKATICSGAITPAPIYRMIRKWKGTIILDEADMRKSDEKNEVVTILNCGFERGRPLIRSSKENPDDLQVLPTFSPKILATRGRFRDVALEARCLTEILTETDRDDIPYLLPPAFYEEEKKLRNKLLMFRFRFRDKIDLNRIFELDLGNVEPRLKQATASFAVLFANIDGVFSQFKQFLEKYQNELIEERSQTLEGKIVRAIFELTHSVHGTFENRVITPSDIEHWIKENLNEEIDVKIIGKKIKSLGLKTEKRRVEGISKRILVLETDKSSILFKRYIPTSELRGDKEDKSDMCSMGLNAEKQAIDFEPLKDSGMCELCGQSGANIKVIFSDGSKLISHATCAFDEYPELKRIEAL